MAENADVEVSITTLAESCLERFKFVRTIYQQDRDSRILTIRLGIEQIRLFEWRNSLVKHQSSGLRATEADLQPSVRSILELLMGLLDESEQSRLKYGCRALRAAHLTALTIYDQEKFTALITQARYLIDRLHDTTEQWLTPQEQQETLCSRVCLIKDVAMLEIVVDACKPDYSSVSDTVSKHLDSLRSDDGPRITILELTQKQEDMAEVVKTEKGIPENAGSTQTEQPKADITSSDGQDQQLRQSLQQAEGTESTFTDSTASKPSTMVEKVPGVILRSPATWQSHINLDLDLRISSASSLSAQRDSTVTTGETELESSITREDEISQRRALVTTALIDFEIPVNLKMTNTLTWLSDTMIFNKATRQPPETKRAGTELGIFENTVNAFRDKDFKEELDAIMQWFNVLSDGERAASFGRMIPKLTSDQLKFFAGLISSYEKDVAQGTAINVQ